MSASNSNAFPAGAKGPPAAASGSIAPKRETYDNKPAALKADPDAGPPMPVEVSKADWNRRLLEVQEQMRQLAEQIRILVEESALRKKRKQELRGKC